MKPLKEFIKKISYLFRFNHLILKRDRYSHRFISGHGLEIGALNRPLPVKKGVTVEYVDRITKEEAVEKFTRENPSVKILAEPSIIDDGFVLSSLSDDSYDFIAANHVLEHSSNPLQTLENWTRIIRPGGIIFTVVPIAEMTFDRGRKTTTLSHIIDDYNLMKENNRREFNNRNRVHYHENFTISQKNDRIQKGLEPIFYSDEELKRLIDEMIKNGDDVHFHTFTVESYREMIEYFCETQGSLEIAAFDVNKDEIICLIRKKVTATVGDMHP